MAFWQRDYTTTKHLRLFGVLILCSFTWLDVSSSSYVSDYCAHFELPELPADSTVTADEQDRITIPFRLVANPHSPSKYASDKLNCSAMDQVFIMVSKNAVEDYEPHRDYCVMRVSTTEPCESFMGDAPCRCADDGMGGIFSTVVGVEDTGTWRWWTQGNWSPIREVSFKIRGTTTTTTTTESTTLSDNDSKDEATTSSDGNNDSPTTQDTQAKNEDKEKEGKGGGGDYKVGASKNADGGSDMTVPYVGAIVAGANIASIVLIGVLIMALRHACNKKGRSQQTVSEAEQGGNRNSVTLRKQGPGNLDMSSTYSYFSHAGKGLCVSTSSIYEEIPANPAKLVVRDTSIYLNPKSS